MTPDQLQEIIKVAVVQAINLVDSGALSGSGRPDLLDAAIEETKTRVEEAIQDADEAELVHDSESHEYRAAQDWLKRMRTRLNDLEMEQMLTSQAETELPAEEKSALAKHAI